MGEFSISLQFIQVYTRLGFGVAALLLDKCRYSVAKVCTLLSALLLIVYCNVSGLAVIGLLHIYLILHVLNSSRLVSSHHFHHHPSLLPRLKTVLQILLILCCRSTYTRLPLRTFGFLSGFLEIICLYL